MKTKELATFSAPYQTLRTDHRDRGHTQFDQDDRQNLHGAELSLSSLEPVSGP